MISALSGLVDLCSLASVKRRKPLIRQQIALMRKIGQGSIPLLYSNSSNEICQGTKCPLLGTSAYSMTSLRQVGREKLEMVSVCY